MNDADKWIISKELREQLAAALRPIVSCLETYDGRIQALRNKAWECEQTDRENEARQHRAERLRLERELEDIGSYIRMVMRRRRCE